MNKDLPSIFDIEYDKEKELYIITFGDEMIKEPLGDNIVLCDKDYGKPIKLLLIKE